MGRLYFQLYLSTQAFQENDNILKKSYVLIMTRRTFCLVGLKLEGKIIGISVSIIWRFLKKRKD
jgi:phage regulator Rha-like protein